MNIYNFVADMNCYFSRKPDIVREKRQDPLHCTPPKGSYGQRTVNLAIVINSGGHNIIREDSETVDNSLYVIRFPYIKKERKDNLFLQHQKLVLIRFKLISFAFLDY